MTAQEGIPWRWVFAGGLAGYWLGSLISNRLWLRGIESGVIRVGARQEPLEGLQQEPARQGLRAREQRPRGRRPLRALSTRRF